jgi:hypothetical protein
VADIKEIHADISLLKSKIKSNNAHLRSLTQECEIVREHVAILQGTMNPPPVLDLFDKVARLKKLITRNEERVEKCTKLLSGSP